MKRILPTVAPFCLVLTTAFALVLPSEAGARDLGDRAGNRTQDRIDGDRIDVDVRDTLRDAGEKVGDEVRDELDDEAGEIRDELEEEADEVRDELEEEVDEACNELKEETGKGCD